MTVKEFYTVSDFDGGLAVHQWRCPHVNTPVTICLPHVRGSQPQARDISLPKLYNGSAMA